LPSFLEAFPRDDSHAHILASNFYSQTIQNFQIVDQTAHEIAGNVVFSTIYGESRLRHIIMHSKTDELWGNVLIGRHEIGERGCAGLLLRSGGVLGGDQKHETLAG